MLNAPRLEPEPAPRPQQPVFDEPHINKVDELFGPGIFGDNPELFDGEEMDPNRDWEMDEEEEERIEEAEAFVHALFPHYNLNDLLEGSVNQLQELVGYQVQRLHCCVNGRIAFTGRYAGIDKCPCGGARYQATKQRLPVHNNPNEEQEPLRARDRALKPRKSFFYFPIIPRLLLQYANTERVKALATYAKQREKYYSETHVLTDYWNRRLREEVAVGYGPQGILTRKNVCDVALLLTGMV
ncbi:hypothetical protein DFH27DRAFT_596769 [Peziza echinospora]|nr:hypothetical protein DFH27DRAFT_596769 [Peziza echinospora]